MKEELQEALDWTWNFLQDKLKSPHASIRKAANDALARFRQFSGRSLPSEMTADTVKDAILGTDSSVYFTPQRQPRKEDEEIAELDQKMKDDGRMTEDGRLRRYAWVQEIVPTRITNPLDGTVQPFETKTTDDYMKGLLYGKRRYDEMSLFNNNSPNVSSALYYNYDKGETPLGKDDWEVRGEITGPVDEYDTEYNNRYAKAIKKGVRAGRYAGNGNIAILHRKSNDPQKSGYYMWRTDMVPQDADVADLQYQDYFPFEGQYRLNQDYGKAEWNKSKNAIDAHSPWKSSSTAETVHRRGRLVRLQTDENGNLTDSAIEKIKQSANTEGNSRIKYVDPATGGITQERRIYYSRGGRLPKAPTRDKYGNKIARADNLGTRDYDVYF